MTATTENPGKSWFFVPELAQPGETGILPPGEARHATGARRLREDDTLTATNGHGTVATLQITRLDPRGRNTEFTITARRSVPESSRRIGLVAAVPKGDRQTILLDMATQFGMTDYWPLVSERSVTKPEGIADRWTRTTIEAIKQCRRAWLPVLHEAVDLDTLAAIRGDCTLLLADVDGASVASQQSRISRDGSIFIVGPEGGFSGAEHEQLTGAGAIPVRLGDAVLRTESAAIAAVLACTVCYTDALLVDD